jgi:predicted chitinase
MSSESRPEIVEEHATQRGRTLLELTQRDDGTWIATQQGVDLEGTGETGALAAMAYCRKVAERV